MSTHDSKSPRASVFSHPIRRLSAAELEKVVGGKASATTMHTKCDGGMDNQGRNFAQPV